MGPCVSRTPPRGLSRTSRKGQGPQRSRVPCIKQCRRVPLGHAGCLYRGLRKQPPRAQGRSVPGGTTWEDLPRGEERDATSCKSLARFRARPHPATRCRRVLQHAYRAGACSRFQRERRCCAGPGARPSGRWRFDHQFDDQDDRPSRRHRLRRRLHGGVPAGGALDPRHGNGDATRPHAFDRSAEHLTRLGEPLPTACAPDR